MNIPLILLSTTIFTFLSGQQPKNENTIFSIFKSHPETPLDMKAELAVLDQHLRTKRPDFYSKLNPPLTIVEIEALEAKYDRSLPPDLILLYSWKNGQDENCSKSFVNNSTFIPLEDALSSAAELTSMIGSDFEIENWWNKDWIPIFSNGGGDYICHDQDGTFTGQSGQLLEFWHADNDRNVIAPTLPIFIKKLNDYYEATPAQDFDGFFEIENPAGFPKKFILE